MTDLDPRPKVELQLPGGQVQTVRLTAPESMATRYDIWIAAASNFQRAAAAALGLCANDPKVSGTVPFRGDVLAYGGAVIDHLMRSKVPYSSISAAAGVAYHFVTDELVELEEAIAETRGNSEAPPDTSTA